MSGIVFFNIRLSAQSRGCQSRRLQHQSTIHLSKEREDLEQDLVRNHRHRCRLAVIDQRSNHRHRRDGLLHP